MAPCMRSAPPARLERVRLESCNEQQHLTVVAKTPSLTSRQAPPPPLLRIHRNLVMQTLTIPASISKRKQACRSCRQRKKKCDAEHPACALCKKWSIRCEYTVPAESRDSHQDLGSDAPRNTWPAQSISSADFEFMQLPGLNFDLTPHIVQTQYPTPNSTTHFDEISEQQDLLAVLQLPSNDVLMELVEIFFSKLGHMFPCFHRGIFLHQVQSGAVQNDSPLVLHSICCVAARYHQDPTVRSRQKTWYEQAKLAYELTQREPHPGLRTIQAVLILVFYGYTAGDFSSTWLFLGKVWRQAVALGMNRMDASQSVPRSIQAGEIRDADKQIYSLENCEGTTAVEREEYRRTLWMLFIMDRNHAWPTGWPNAIFEQTFKVDLPIADAIFQSMNMDTQSTPVKNVSFTRNFDSLIASSSTAQDPLNVFHSVCVAHVLLGRVADLVHSLHDTPNTLEYAEECKQLDAHLVKFRLSLPRRVTSVLEAQPADRGHVVWLQIMLNTSAMVLHYRCASDVPVANPLSHFILAVTAARNIADIVKDASRISIDLLLSAHIGSSLYVAACILVIQWRTTNDCSLKEDIDIFTLVFERMNEVFAFLGLKLKFALEHDLKRSKENLEELRDRGIRGFLTDCSKWTHVREEVQRRGLLIDIT
ncbi:hypothetical protein CC86DRAFT_135307 [Ophiobolus disseminans]|uniref:Zn(2)-C6 fungal-type domain-containing protein n=1 Tax=Ophiobolus disseminans TaxID=1469910 RepID=A0A6A7AD11_9PLEO|nr:hypothetical protein CC86DRAFT_135307 [Ophiobolus disseminans]